MSQTNQQNTEATWLTAQEYCKALGTQPGFFAAAVRLLLADHQRNPTSLRPATKLLVSYALRGKKLLSMLYYSASCLAPQSINGKNSVSLGDLINAYTPYDLAIIYTVYLNYRKCRNLYQKDPPRFLAITKNFGPESQLGGLVGAAIPTIGIGNGTLAGSLHHLALSLFAVKHYDRVIEYLKNIRGRSLSWDLKLEHEGFGCSSFQLGSLLLTRMGFSSTLVDLYWRSLDPDLRKYLGNSPQQHSIEYGRLWIEGVSKRRTQPTELVPGEFYPVLEKMTWLKQEAELVLMGSRSWFERDAADISEEQTPELFADGLRDPEVPEEIRSIFSLKELSSMEESEFDDLIDQIDKKIEDGTLHQETSSLQNELLD